MMSNHDTYSLQLVLLFNIRGGIDDLARGIDLRKVERPSAEVSRGTERAPLLIRHATEKLQNYIDLTNEPDETVSSIPTGFYMTAKGKFYSRIFAARNATRFTEEMTKPISESDKHGYVYAYLIEDVDMPFILRIKIGRTVDMQARLSSWQRESYRLVSRKHQDETLEANPSRNGNFEPGETAKYCHRLERLVHIELADLAMHPRI
ncbi:hypothetical protein ACEPAF_5163 [Sanghuangporus sanghuang]